MAAPGRDARFVLADAERPEPRHDFLLVREKPGLRFLLLAGPGPRSLRSCPRLRRFLALARHEPGAERALRRELVVAVAPQADPVHRRLAAAGVLGLVIELEP